MKISIPFALVGTLVAAAFAQAAIEVDITGTSADHQLSWTTIVNYNYKVFMSPDLETWIDTGIAEQGNGSPISYDLESTSEKLFYRIQETPDQFNGGFLVLPTQDEEVDLIDGVCFSFNLDIFPTLPTKIRIDRRDYNTGDPWKQIGQITDFDEIDGIKFVRGSAVWIPEVGGEYEIRATAVDGSSSVIASAIRRVFVGSNQAPSITIISGPTTPSVSRQAAIFNAIATDPDGDEVRRVEFYDNGILIGVDTHPNETSPGVFEFGDGEFGDGFKDIEGNSYDLLKGTHNITAKAFDSRGAIGQTASASQYGVTGGNSRPTIDVTSPTTGLVVTQGQSFTVVYTENDPDGASDIIEVEAYDIITNDRVIDAAPPFNDLIINTTGWEPGTHTIRVLARDISRDESYPVYLSIFVRTGIGSSFAETLVASIVDETTATPSNEVFTGVKASSGVFSSGFASGLEVDNGALLTTGSFALWNGGDDDPIDAGRMDERRDLDFGTDNYKELGDPELEDRVVGIATFDASVLEFDVFCANGQLELIYQF